jgi:hypothetical protein
LNPSNVLIDDRGKVKVFDFGVAAASYSFLWKMDDEISLYLAPELLAGRDPTARSDTFAVGAILWAMLTGSPPGPGSLGGTEHVPQALADVPTAIARLSSQALALNPQARPASLEEFATGLNVAFATAGDTRSRRPGGREAGGLTSPPSSSQTQKEGRQVSAPFRASELRKLADPASVEASLRKLVRDREARAGGISGRPVLPLPPSSNRHPDGELDPDQRDRPSASDESEDLRTDD